MKSLSIDIINTQAGTQMRAGTRLETINEYAELLAGDKRSWPFTEPIIVFTDGETYWLADGFHRIAAAKAAGRSSVKCEIKNGTLADAQDYALAANQNHGLRRSNDDKRRAVEFALNCPRWVKKSDRSIAEHLGVSNVFVGQMRKQLLTVNSCDEREGADGKVRKLPERQQSEVIQVVVPTENVEYEYEYRDESEPLAEGEIDCGIVEEPVIQAKPGQAIDSAESLVQSAIRMYVSPLVRLTDKIAESNGGKGPVWEACNNAFDVVLKSLEQMKEGQR